MLPGSDSTARYDSLTKWWNGRYRDAILARFLFCEAHGIEEDETEAALCVVALTFGAPKDVQWPIIRELVERAEESALEAIAAGPIEGFLGRFGDEVIADVEAEAARDAKFRRTLSGVWQHMMSDAVFARVKAAAGEPPTRTPPAS